ncbi:protein disulfide isomerase [Heterostelium album PN500]|uniref:protein disulfide-isomerase n=1 Tax=Heterostelium pallidum (strain ATCC 26659 / Pp 5 / PN500) TaxID=670386 RepID=D3BP03_HETP5|nr:protein disulfide isomerase [Heterostelium album PN500]EFA77013.1 protein disulfide isomerase [Heterostelium album PN500]|eukprot:XP_020429143.1 protein disulfide isomerase [Heterostelium album PN500]
MKINKFVILATIVILCAVAIGARHSHFEEEDGPSDDNVISMNETNFNEVITGHYLVLVVFCMSWSGHCKNLKPHYSEASKSFATNNKVAFGKVDCIVENNLCQSNKVELLPTLILFRNGEPEPFELGDKTASGIIIALTSVLLPPITIIGTEKDLDRLKAFEKDVIVGFFDNDHDNHYATFKKLAFSMKKFIKFGAVINNKEFSAKHVKSIPSANIYTKFDDFPVVPFTGNSFEPEELTRFIQSSILPTLGEYSDLISRNYPIDLPIAYLFVNTSEKETTETTIAEVTKIAAAHKGKIIFCSVNNPRYAEYLGLSGSKFPALVIQNIAKQKKLLFPENKEFTQTAVSEFVQQVNSSQNQSVKIIVGNTFDQIVLDETKDVLVEFYAPWCPYIWSLKPTYEKLGDYMAKYPHIVIGKIDATANDVPPELDIRGFPTIKFFKANDKKNPVTFEGERDLATLVEFIKEHSIQALKSTESNELVWYH